MSLFYHLENSSALKEILCISFFFFNYSCLILWGHTSPRSVDIADFLVRLVEEDKGVCVCERERTMLEKDNVKMIALLKLRKICH